MDDNLYLHFTDLASAEAIVASGFLRAGRWTGAYAAPVGGRYVPDVQHTEIGEATARDWAVLFTPAEAPDLAFVEEAVWRGGRVDLVDAMVLPAAEVIDLLDDSRGDLEE
jgi:hypothetical protein